MKEIKIFKIKNIHASIKESKYENVFWLEYRNKKENFKTEFGCFICNMRRYESKRDVSYIFTEKNDIIIIFFKNYKISVLSPYSESSFKLARKDFENAMKKLDEFIKKQRKENEMDEFKIERDGIFFRIKKDWVLLTFQNKSLKFEINDSMSITQNLYWLFFNSNNFYFAIAKDFDKELRICSDGFEILIRISKKEKRDLSEFLKKIKDDIDDETWENWEGMNIDTKEAEFFKNKLTE